jgi:hypothetical protein
MCVWVCINRHENKKTFLQSFPLLREIVYTGGALPPQTGQLFLRLAVLFV